MVCGVGWALRWSGVLEAGWMNDSMEEVVSGQLKMGEARESEMVEDLGMWHRRRWVGRFGKRRKVVAVG
jgi:hypothetical protein